MFKSKKFVAALVGAVVLFAGSLLGLDADTQTQITGLIVVYILGQSVADIGKEKAKIEHHVK